MGTGGFTFAYSVLSIGVLTWLISAAGRAPFVSLWYWQPWHNHVVSTIMLVVCLILALAIGRPSPFSLGGSENVAFDPDRPGIVGVMRHPLLAAIAFWALAHVFANGDLAHLIMFGTFAAFAMTGGSIIDRRKKRLMGAEREELRHRVKQSGLSKALLSLMREPIRLLAGAAGYVALIVAHPHLFGVNPIAG
ncbi:NnrU family protein [Altererythrobacter epoxidivorans]|nr:NnrU family protein [Altererythrobacter epoxidivorans]